MDPRKAKKPEPHNNGCNLTDQVSSLPVLKLAATNVHTSIGKPSETSSQPVLAKVEEHLSRDVKAIEPKDPRLRKRGSFTLPVGPPISPSPASLQAPFSPNYPPHQPPVRPPVFSSPQELKTGLPPCLPPQPPFNATQNAPIPFYGPPYPIPNTSVPPPNFMHPTPPFCPPWAPYSGQNDVKNFFTPPHAQFNQTRPYSQCDYPPRPTQNDQYQGDNSYPVKTKGNTPSETSSLGSRSQDRDFSRGQSSRSSESERRDKRDSYRSPPRSSSRDERRSRFSERRRERSRSRSRGRQRRSRSFDRSRSRRSRSRDKQRSRSRDRRRSRSRDRQRSRSRDRKRSRSRDRQRSRSRDRRRRSPSYNRRRYRRSNRSRSFDRSRESSRSERSPARGRTGREQLIDKWRRLNCKDDEELEKRLMELSKMNSDQLLKEQSSFWIRSAPATTFYERDLSAVGLMNGTLKLEQLCIEFEQRLLDKGRQIRAAQSKFLPPQPKRRVKGKCMHQSYTSCSSNSEDEEDGSCEESQIMEELERKISHPFRLHRELWFNEPGEMNDGPLCKCSERARRSGIRHGIYAGEPPPITPQNERKCEAISDNNSEHGIECSKNEIVKMEPVNTIDEKVNNDPMRCISNSNNSNKLYHYRITISPPTNFLSKTPTIINHDNHEYIFTGFSLFSHYPLPKLPVCKVIRFNIEYIILYAEESFPENFTIRECDLFFTYLFGEILELVDLDLFPSPEHCPVFHFMPRFVRELQPEGHELLPMCMVLKYLITNYKPLVPKELLNDIPKTSNSVWQEFADNVKGMIVTKPGMKPSSIRVDQLDKDVEKKTAEDEKAERLADKITREIKSQGLEQEEKKDEEESSEIPYPEIIHFGVRPPQLSYAGNQDYQKAWREYIKHRHLIANLAKPSIEDKQKLAAKEEELQKMRTKSNMKRDVTATISSKGFFTTGLMCDVVQHAMLIPVLACHLRFHRSLNVLEERIGYTFKNRYLLQLALTHPSYRENFGTNPDHARNSLTNCGIRQPEYGDRRIHYMSTKKRGISTLMNIMSRFGSKREKESSIYHNERLEFLGDAVVEFVSTIHLFHMFRDLEEGGLATYRAALVQNQHLAVLAKVLSLDAYLLYAHGSDLCHDLELNHALANCFEALMGALFLDGNIDVADRVFGQTVFGDDDKLLETWEKYPPHPLQDQEPEGDRRWIEKVDFLENLAKFEESIGVEFKHIRLLARAFTDRSVGYTNLTLGSNQRLEFLGDSVLQLVASDYLYKHFPDHHEGHLSLLRSSLVNNNTQSVVCDDLGMTVYARYAATKGDLKVKDKADLLEAFLGALYIDSGCLEWVEQFCKVCFFPRLQDFIMNQEWNDPKSKLQQCCLTLRTIDGGEPDIPCYKVVECKGPTNTRTYSVAVYFRRKRLATASGHSIQQAEMNAAQAAMKTCGDLFPQLDHQKRVMGKHSLSTRHGKPISKRDLSNTKRSRRGETPERYKVGGRSPSRSRSRSRSSSSSRSYRSPSITKPRRSSSRSSSPSPPRRQHRRVSKSSSPEIDSVNDSPEVKKEEMSEIVSQQSNEA